MVKVMKDNLERMRNETKNAEKTTASFRNQGSLFVGGNLVNLNGRGVGRMNGPPGINFGGFNNNHFGDEQLLEGLGDETGNRLF